MTGFEPRTSVTNIAKTDFPLNNCWKITARLTTGLTSLSPSNNASKSSCNFMAVVLQQNQFYSIGPWCWQLPLYH